MSTETTIHVLDQGFVRLVEVMGSDAAIVQAARVSYGQGTKSVREDAALIDYLMRHRHTSPFEMVEFKFHVRAPIFVARQWFRHRTASVNERSLRYSESEEAFYHPQGWRRQARNNKQGSEGIFENAEADAALENAYRSAYAAYQKLLSLGVAREEARVVLPVGLYTEFYWKQDLHNLLHFIQLRLDAHAQYEIRVYAGAIAEFVKRHVPLAWRAFEEHVLHATTISRTEREILRQLVDRDRYRSALAEAGLGKGRIREALAKIFPDSGKA